MRYRPDVADVAGSSEEAIARRVKRVLVDELELEVAPSDIQLDDVLYAPHIQLESLGYLKLILGLEQEFGFHVGNDETGRVMFETVRDIVAYVNRKVAA